MERKSWELTPEQRNEMENIFEYNKYVYQQQEHFIIIMNYIDNIINEMLENGEISEYGEFRARIKSPKSALKNDPVKALDDVFGMEIITATEFEYEKIMKELEEFMTVQKSKDHNKKNGYKAKHRMMTLMRDKLEILGIPNSKFEEIPMIEFQFKTFQTLMQVETGTAKHSDYKNEDMAAIQEKYDKYGCDPYELPTMWVSKGGKMVMLTPDEAMKKIYPLLKPRDRKKGVEK